MEKLLDKINILKEELDKKEEVIKIRKLNKDIKDDKELIKNIEEYRYLPSELNKEKVVSNIKFREYKECETDINILILEINKKLSEINDRGKCGL